MTYDVGSANGPSGRGCTIGRMTDTAVLEPMRTALSTPLVKRSVPARSPIHGWGLFAREDIAAGELIDESPLLILARTPGGMADHVYELLDGRRAAVLGDGVLANSADRPNARFDLDLEREVVTLTATDDIAVGDEITIDYAYD